ncbi:DUF2065 domain-containing protein [Desulfogranum mediterraneum]|uniref:DUF2065 domain-containing protein n=1 Tax=Desulfogranum mediterraneum TaxID=160661 RepID=UPI0004165FAE|nr:DUF2065 domain-containing protein [Desulfogranum mediterraneum]
MKLLITLIGLVFILEGLPYVVSPEGMRRWLKQLLELSSEQLRLIGIVAMIVGFILCFIGQRSGLFS